MTTIHLLVKVISDILKLMKAFIICMLEWRINLMEIGQVIRKYRKKENLTQEQVAGYLNVSAPAVNKWENGISYPDISLLAPLARVLKIDINMLLSFNLEITKEERKSFLNDVSNTILERGYEAGFEKGSALIKEYPNCDELIIRVAEILNVGLKVGKVNNNDKYDKKIISWYELIASSSNEKTALMGKYDLAVKYIDKKDYEKAQQMLDSMNIDDTLGLCSSKKILQAQIFEKTGKNKDSYEIYDEIILKSAGEIMTALSFIIMHLCDENKYDVAEEYNEVYKKTNELYQLGAYSRIVSEMTISMKKEDKEQIVNDLEKVINEFNNFKEDTSSNLYSFRKYKTNSADTDEWKRLLKRTIEINRDFDFIRDDERVQTLLKRLDV